MEELSIDLFRNLWQTNVKDLETLCEEWENICNDDTVPDEVLGDIRTTVGLARLLLRQKLLQFKGLIDDSEFKTGEKEITYFDLQGFWDMVYNEVEKIQKGFEKLHKCKNNEWKFVEETTVKPVKKKVPVQNVSNKKTVTTNSHSLAAKQRLIEAKRKMLAQKEKQKEEALVEIIQPLKESTFHIHERTINNVSSGVIELKERNGEVKHSPHIQKMVTATADKDNIGSKVPPKIKDQQNKENFLIQENLSSKSQMDSKESTEIPHKKSRGQSKDFGKLQCLTRSAKKALMAKQKAL